MKSVQAQADELAAWIKQRMEVQGIRFAAELVRMSGVSQSTLGNILDPKPAANTGKYSLPRRETMIALARSLGVSKDEALSKAGYQAEDEPEEDDLAALTALVVELKKETTDNFAEKRRRLEELSCRVYCAGGQYTVSITSEAIPL